MKIVASIVLAAVLIASVVIVKSVVPFEPVEVSEIHRLDGWNRYHNYTGVVSLLLTLNRTHSDVVDVFSIGRSYFGKSIYCVRLTNESDRRPKPEVFFIGYFHARELITSELCLYFVTYVATNFGRNGTLTDFLNRCEVYVVVALNVDGFSLFAKNGYQRNNGAGVDLNRNYDYMWEGNKLTHPPSLGGPSPFSESETRAVRDLVLAHHFKYAIGFHSGIDLILYPWGTSTEPSPDDATFVELAGAVSRLTGNSARQSSLLYFTYGDWGDWMYGKAHVFALTCEVYGYAMHGDFGSETDAGNRLMHQFNPHEEAIELIVRHWLPAFFYMINRTIVEAGSG